MMKKVLSIALAVLLCCSAIPVSALAEEDPALEAETYDTVADTATEVNAVYGDLLSDEERETVLEEVDTAEEEETVSAPEVYYTTYEEAAQSVREQLKAREKYVCVAYRISKSEYEKNEKFPDDIFDLAYAHTGDPLEGDCLRWCWYLRTQDASLSTCIEDGDDYLFALYYDMTYYDDAEQEAELTAKLDEVMASLGLDGMTDYEKVCTIHQYICDNVTYDNAHKSQSSYLLKYSAYAALCQGTAVCLGYAVLFYRMCLMCGIDARVISGYSYENHAWNIVKLGQYYYYLDTTWDSGYTPETYRYFLTTTGTITNHTRDEEYDTVAFENAFPMAPSNYTLDTCYHSYVVTGTAEDGLVTYTCTACGDTYTGAAELAVEDLGDLNADGAIDGLDALLLQERLTSASSEGDVDAADMDGDGSVDGVDYLLLIQAVTG